VPFITIATEDELSEAVGNRLVKELLPSFQVHQMLRRGGNGYLRKSYQKFNQMALRHPVFLITDLDNATCARELIESWFGDLPINANLIFRVAVKEIESWLLADHEGMQQLLDRGANNIKAVPDELPNPKEYLLQRAKRAPRDVRNDLIPSKGSLARQGLGYNARLCSFVREVWEPERALERSDSLARAIRRLRDIA
jgi:hypothetical protein